MGTNTNTVATDDDLPDPGEGFRWTPAPNGRGKILVATEKSAKTKKVPPAFNVKNTDENPRAFWPGRDSLMMPGQVLTVPAEHRLKVLKDIASGRYEGGVNARTGKPYPPALERTDDPPISTEKYLDKLEEEQKRLDAA